MWFWKITMSSTKYDTNNNVNPHSTEQDTQPIAFLISKHVIPYQTCGGTCCLGVSTPKIWCLADSSTTYHESINHLHHTNHCSNHSIDPHTVNSHLDGWETTTLSQRHKPTQYHKGWKTCMTLMTSWRSITNQAWTQIPKGWGLRLGPRQWRWWSSSPLMPCGASRGGGDHHPLADW
jgi:hypothetical protein